MTDRVFRVNQLVVEDRDAAALTPITFAQLGFLRERDLRPWIENEPEFLGEDVLVVRRAHTVVRNNTLHLDVLAVDRDGALVVVEVKLRDFDDDPHWRAFRHAAACGQRSADDIIGLYATFKGIDRKEAAVRLEEHTGSKDEEDLKAKLNHRQRVVLIARSFRKQITTAALWLREHNIDVSCIRLTPHLDEQTGAYYIKRTDLIPLWATLDLLVDLVSTAEEKERNADQIESHREQIDKFWASVCGKVRNRLRQEMIPTKDSSLGDGAYWLGFSHPWNSQGLYFFTSVVVAQGEPDPFRFTALFQFHEPTLRRDGMSKPTIDKLRRLTAMFAEKPGWGARMGLSGYYEAGKSVDVALDDEGAERAGETLCDVISKMHPRVDPVVGSRMNKRGTG